MDLEYSELEHSIRLIRLNGKLDIAGVREIEGSLASYCAGENTRVIVDLSKVEFIASIGIRLLTLTAKSIVSRGGRMVLVNPPPDVHHVLDVTGIPVIIPIYSDLESAVKTLMPS